MRYDVIVAGMGIHGLMTTYLLAKRGLKVAAVDRHQVPHTHGSSHGRTRVHRCAYFEAPFYVPLLKRADSLWVQFSDEWEFPVIQRTGVLVIGRDNGRLANGALASAREHNIAVEVLDARAAMQRWPALRMHDSNLAVYEKDGGVLQVEHVITKLARLSEELGVTCLPGHNIEMWDSDFDGIRVKLENEDDWMLADHLVLATGPWLSELARMKLPLKVERQYQVLFRTEPGGALSAGRFPAVAIDRNSAPMLYGIPDFGRGYKLAFHHGGRTGDPGKFNQDVSRKEIEALYKAAREWMPGVEREVRAAWTCTYTNTPDEQFIIDRHPSYERVLLMSCCSGHGYKFAPVLGEIASGLIADGGTEYDISQFRLDRFRRA